MCSFFLYYYIILLLFETYFVTDRLNYIRNLQGLYLQLPSIKSSLKSIKRSKINKDKASATNRLFTVFFRNHLR